MATAAIALVSACDQGEGMKCYTALLLFSLVACGQSTVQQTPSKPEPRDNNINKVRTAVEQALKKRDYRFYATSGRALAFPGLNQDSDARLIAQCGHKFTPNTGDVLKSEADKHHRKNQVAFAKAYNQLMLEHCRSL